MVDNPLVVVLEKAGEGGRGPYLTALGIMKSDILRCRTIAGLLSFLCHLRQWFERQRRTVFDDAPLLSRSFRGDVADPVAGERQIGLRQLMACWQDPVGHGRAGVREQRRKLC